MNIILDQKGMTRTRNKESNKNSILCSKLKTPPVSFGEANALIWPKWWHFY